MLLVSRNELIFQYVICQQGQLYEACLTVCSYHVTYSFQSESTLYSCLNVKELLAQNRRDIWSLNDSNGTRTHNHLVRKRTLNHLAKLASLFKWLSVRLRTKWLWVRVPLQSPKACLGDFWVTPSRKLRLRATISKIIYFYHLEHSH